jgi:hypothetical protein
MDMRANMLNGNAHLWFVNWLQLHTPNFRLSFFSKPDRLFLTDLFTFGKQSGAGKN